MKKTWYKKKRIWILFILGIWLISIQLEWAKFRYQKADFIHSISTSPHLVPSFHQKTIKGNTLNYLKLISHPKNPLLVLIHGSPGSLSAFEEYLKDKELVEKTNMVVIDRPGFGYSDNGKVVSSLAIQAAAIAEVLKDFPDQKKILLGHSMGGPVIAKLAMDFPTLVDGLVMVAPAISPTLEPSNTWRKLIDFPLIRLFTPSALRVCNQEIIPLKEELQLMLKDWNSIKIPVTVIQGVDDPLVPAGNADFAKTVMSNNAMVKIKMIKGGNHFILWSEIPLIKSAIFELINSIGQ